MTDGVRGETVTPLMCLEGNHTVTEENRLSERQVLIQLAGRAELHLLGEGVKESDIYFFLLCSPLIFSLVIISPKTSVKFIHSDKSLGCFFKIHSLCCIRQWTAPTGPINSPV